jgi:hypothetical protein
MSERYWSEDLFLPNGSTPPPDVIPNPNYYGAQNPDGSINVTIQADGEEVPIPNVPDKFKNSVFKQNENGEWVISGWTNPRIEASDVPEFCELIKCGEIIQEIVPTIIPTVIPTLTPNPTSTAFPEQNVIIVPSQGDGKTDLNTHKSPGAELNVNIPVALVGTVFVAWAGWMIKDWLQERSRKEEVKAQARETLGIAKEEEKKIEQLRNSKPPVTFVSEESSEIAYTFNRDITTRKEANEIIVDLTAAKEKEDTKRKVGQIKYAEEHLPRPVQRKRGVRPSFGGNSTNPITQWLRDNWLLQNDRISYSKKYRGK